MRLNRRSCMRWGSAVVVAAGVGPLVAVSAASAGTGLPPHRKGHGWATIQVCDPAGRAPYTYTIELSPLSSLSRDAKAYVAYANRTFKYYPGQFRNGRITVTDAPAKPTEIGGVHYADGHNHDPLTARVVSGPSCA